MSSTPMSSTPIRRRIDEGSARNRFEMALASHAQVPGEFFLAQLLGLQFRYLPERCVVEFEVQDFMFNPRGSLHGGILSLVLDVAMGHLMLHAGRSGATLEFKTQFLRSVSGGWLRCEASILKAGCQAWFMEARCTDAQDRLVAISTSTWHAAQDSGKEVLPAGVGCERV